ncbi:hypothetical protein Vi05172_g10856 [Venturia inaequalis]|nr:hypothetical protein Vi05172_g10856 [Venturia inaequalis]
MDFEDDEVDAILQVAVAGHLIGYEMLSEELGREVERWNARMVMFSKDRDFANRRTAIILDEATHPDIIKIESRLTKYQFKSLARWLEQNATVSDSKYAILNTKLMLFLHICGHDASFRSTGTRFWMPWSQISKYFHQVLEGLVQLAQEAIQGYDINDSPSVPTKIYADKRYHTFWNCLGAVDGTLIPASIKGGDRLGDGGEGAYRCRKGWLALNVIGCVDFDINFKYVYPGWECSAHDATVFNDAVRRGEFVTPKGRFWLADAGYSQADGYGGQLLAPYMGERYHLAEWEIGNKRHHTKEELFNLRHSKMRNVVGRTYGVWKMRFRIFQCPRDGFSLETSILPKRKLFG